MEGFAGVTFGLRAEERVGSNDAGKGVSQGLRAEGRASQDLQQKGVDMCEELNRGVSLAQDDCGEEKQTRLSSAKK